MHKGINCTYERNIYLGKCQKNLWVHKWVSLNCFSKLWVKWAICELYFFFNPYFFSFLGTSYLTIFSSHGLMEVVMWTGTHFVYFVHALFKLFFGHRGQEYSPKHILRNFEGLDKQAFSYFENLATSSANNKLSRAGN